MRARTSENKKVKIRSIALFLVLVVMAVFLVINWAQISAVTTVNLVYTEVQAPLGIIIVCGFAVVIFLMLIYTVWQAASVTMELRTAHKETRNARALADDAEKSRFAESNKLFTERFDKLETMLVARQDELAQELRRLTEQLDTKVNGVKEEVNKQQGLVVSKVSESLNAFENRLQAALPSPVVAKPTSDNEELKNEEMDTKKKKGMFEDLF